MIVTVIISILAVLVVILGFTTYNLLRKNEKQEDIVAGYLAYLDSLSRTIEISDKKLKELDRGGVFEKDDEVGVIFQSILKIQEILNEFNIRKSN
jgi:type II secretory pathway pseudopilin PulG